MPKSMYPVYKRHSRSKYYNKYRTLKNQGLILYPSPYESLILYYNEITVFSDAANTAAFYAGAYRIQRQVAHVALRPYFSQYRVEKVTMSLQFSEAGTQNSCYMATTHAADGATTAASTPTVTSIRSYKDSQIYQIGQNCPKKVWYFSSNDPQETIYRDVAAATITNDDEFQVGGVQFFVAQNIGTGVTSVTMFVKYKVRYIGKQAIAL